MPKRAPKAFVRSNGSRPIGKRAQRASIAKTRRCFAARLNDVLAGIGGLTVEPVIAHALRMRRFYVRPAFRRSGVGLQLATALLARVIPGRLITVNAAPTSFPFWESVGFTPHARDGHTHILNRERR